MSEDSDNFAKLLQRVREGSEDAAREFLVLYESHILRTVRRKLSRELRSRFDSVDFVQAVWASFFAHRSNLTTFVRPEQLIGYLIRMASNKVIKEFRRRLMTQKRDIHREISLDGSAHQRALSVADRQPTPSQVVMAREQWDKLLDGQPAHYQRILMLRRTGMSYREIAQEVGLSKKTVFRVIQKLCPIADG